MFSKKDRAFIRKVAQSKLSDLYDIISRDKDRLEKVFQYIDKSIKLIVESYNKYGVTDSAGKAQ